MVFNLFRLSSTKRQPYYAPRAVMLERLSDLRSALIHQPLSTLGSTQVHYAQTYRFQAFGIEVSQQKQQDWGHVKQLIRTQLGLDAQGHTAQIIGNCGASSYTSEASELMEGIIREILSNPDSLLLFGATGHGRDVNGCLNNVLEKSPSMSKQVLANIVDGDTSHAISEYGSVVSSQLKNYFIVYSHNEPRCTFGDDLEASDGLTDELYCFEGGPQSFAQCINVLANGKKVQVYTGLLTEERAAKREVVAAELINYLKDAFDTPDFKKLSEEDKAIFTAQLIPQYLRQMNKNIKNIEAWDQEPRLSYVRQGLELIIQHKLWDAFKHVEMHYGTAATASRPTVSFR